MSEPRVLSIPPGAPFIPTLVGNLLAGRIIPGFAPREDPLALSRLTIWVPTRRAVRSMTATFLDRFDGRAALLPSIRALGDAEDDDPFEASSALTPSASIGSIRRTLVLARLIEAWASGLNDAQRALFMGDDIIVPATAADAIGLASQLAELMDTVATEEANWTALEDVLGERRDELQAWWQLTLDFLSIANVAWPAYLAERNAEDAAAARVAALRAQAALYRARGEDAGPVIAAGSTGSIPATAELLNTIARLPQGALVLPGLDRDLDARTWTQLDVPDTAVLGDDGTAPAHPQFGLRLLLKKIGVPREAVEHLSIPHDDPGRPRLRESLVSAALRPSATTEKWRDYLDAVSSERRTHALQGVALVEAAGEREEALAIALALRETLEHPSERCALVTPDRNLGRRVAAELRRFGVEVDDSAGLPLDNRPAGQFARLVVAQGFGPANPQVTAALTLHGLARFGVDAATAVQAGRVFQIAGLRGKLAPVVNGGFATGMDFQEGEKRAPLVKSRMSAEDRLSGRRLADTLDAIFDPARLPDPGSRHTVAALARRSIELIEASADNGTGEKRLDGLYGRVSGHALRDWLATLLDDGDAMEIEARAWPAVFDALMAGQPVRPPLRSGGAGSHPRVAILGPIEARLQSFDRVVLGGLNEGSWPQGARTDPFLSRPMKVALGLPAPERRTGLAAHDFSDLMGNPDVVLTRALRVADTPAVASRWLQRLTTLAGEEASMAMRAAGRRFTDWAAAIEMQLDKVPSAEQPRPSPPVAVRPRSLSVTQVSTWINDPYAIYAREILQLAPLDPFTREADTRERGTLFHTAVEEFVRLPAKMQTLDMLLENARGAFDEKDVPDEVLARWWPRFQQAAAQFVEWQGEHAASVRMTLPEVYGVTGKGLDDFEMRGTADRFDLLRDGGVELWDYKTTGGPSAKSVQALEQPQLPLLAQMARHGAFAKLPPDHVMVRLGYIRLLGSNGFKADTVAEGETRKRDDEIVYRSADDLAAEAWQRLASLVDRYRDEKQPYVSKARYLEDQPYPSPYDHLARVAEWSQLSTTGEGDR